MSKQNQIRLSSDPQHIDSHTFESLHTIGSVAQQQQRQVQFNDSVSNFQSYGTQNNQINQCQLSRTRMQSIESVKYRPQNQQIQPQQQSMNRLFSNPDQINTQNQHFEGQYSHISLDQDQHNVFNQFQYHQISSQTTINDIEKNSFNSKSPLTNHENMFCTRLENAKNGMHFNYGENAANNNQTGMHITQPNYIAQQQIDSEAQQFIDDGHLGIKMNGQYHLVDTIVQFKRTKAKKALFRLQMCCSCCKNKHFWLNMITIDENGTETLKQLAIQVQELYMDGIDIQSQKTNEQLDFEEEQEVANFLSCWENDKDFQNQELKQNKTRLSLDREQILDLATKKQKQNSSLKNIQQNEKSYDNIEINKNQYKIISENNDSIALNKSQVSMHDNYQNCMNDSITNAQFDFSVVDDDDENSQMMCDIPIIADSVNHEITAQAPMENHSNQQLMLQFRTQSRTDLSNPFGNCRNRQKSQNSNFSRIFTENHHEFNQNQNEKCLQFQNKSFTAGSASQNQNFRNLPQFGIQNLSKPVKFGSFKFDNNVDQQNSQGKIILTPSGLLEQDETTQNYLAAAEQTSQKSHFTTCLGQNNRFSKKRKFNEVSFTSQSPFVHEVMSMANNASMHVPCIQDTYSPQRFQDRSRKQQKTDSRQVNFESNNLSVQDYNTMVYLQQSDSPFAEEMSQKQQECQYSQNQFCGFSLNQTSQNGLH